MGSAQSASGVSSDPSPKSSLSPSSSEENKLFGSDIAGAAEPGIGSSSSSEGNPPKKKKKRSVDQKCRPHKRAWKSCVADHYEKKFLPGKSLEPEDDCDDFFDRFKDCYMKGMLKQRREKGAAPPKKDTMLHEYMVEEGMVNDDN